MDISGLVSLLRKYYRNGGFIHRGSLKMFEIVAATQVLLRLDTILDGKATSKYISPQMMLDRFRSKSGI